MSDLQEIDVYLQPDGNVRVEVRGVKGAGCLAITREMEQLLGGRVSDRAHTDEFSQTAQARSESDRLRQGAS